MIKGVRLVDLIVHSDDRGDLFEVVHNYDLPQEIIPGTERLERAKFGQVYIVHDRMPYIVRAFHRHQELWDYFCIVHGSAIFCLVDARDSDEPLSKDKIMRIVLTSRKPQLLVVPPGVFHGWMSLEPDTILLSVGSELYNRENPDEERVPPHAFDQLFGRNPWEVWAK